MLGMTLFAGLGTWWTWRVIGLIVGKGKGEETSLMLSACTLIKHKAQGSWRSKGWDTAEFFKPGGTLNFNL